jgi:hypothetical protein
MITDNGGVRTAKTLMNASEASDGYRALYLRKRLDLTVEAVVLENKRWHSLFTPDELAKAKARSEKYGYSAPAI